MSKYIDADKLKAEIERYENTAIDAYNPKGEDADFWHGKVVACEDIKTFIDSLQQEQPIQVCTLTWKDINDLERIINNVHYEFRNGIGEKSFGEEVLERFREERDEQEPEEDLEKEVSKWWDAFFKEPDFKFRKHRAHIVTNDEIIKLARHFYELGLNARKEE